MKKFKVGDRVRIVSSGRWGPCLAVGSCARVRKVDYSDNSLQVTGVLEGRPCEQWVGFEDVVKPESQKIVVTTDGETTTARLFSGKELVKSVTAKCSLQDEFVFETGAALALDRLLDPEAKAEPEAPKFPREELKTGVFGRMSNGWWFVIVDDSFIYETGKYDHVARVDEGGKLMFKSVDCLVKAVSFDNARDNARKGELIWARPGVKFE